MRLRLTKLWVAVGLMLAMWGLGRVRESEPRVWPRPVGTQPGPVRIIQFYASVGTVTVGQSAQLCYGVENARVVRIAPMLPGVFPSPSHCVQVVPNHTTHYTLLAEGYDGKVETRSFTLSVLSIPFEPRNVHYAQLPENYEPQPQAQKLAEGGGLRAHAEEL